MSNVNSFLGWYNLPTQVIGTGTETPLLVPAQGTYSILPSPTLPAGGGLHLDMGNDVLANMTYDAHPFTVRVAGKINVAATGTVAVAFRLGTSSTASSNTAIGSSTPARFVTSSLTAGAYNFWFEVEFMWDSVSQNLVGVASGLVGGIIAPQTATAPPLSVPVTSTGMSPTFQFIPTFTFGAVNAANSVTVSEFLIDRGA